MTDTPITTAAQMREAAVQVAAAQLLIDWMNKENSPEVQGAERMKSAIIRAIRAIPCAEPDVQVKPLRFEEMRNNYWGHKSHEYQVAWNDGNLWRVRLHGKVICKSIKGHPAAVDWANKHHERRIRECLK